MTELNRIRGIIEDLKPELTKRYHLHRIGLFGEVLSENFLVEEDDIDIIVQFKKPIDHRIMDLTELLEEKLQAKISLVTKDGIDKAYLREIRSEILYI